MDGFRRIEGGVIRSQTSGLTADESGESATSEGSVVTKSMSTEWTDEKHSLYLESMETSFVIQLYKSMNLQGWRLQKEASDPKLYRRVRCGDCNHSGQKMNYQRTETQRNMKEESRDHLANRWIQRFMSVRKPQAVGSPDLLETSASKSPKFDLNGKMATSCGSAASSKNCRLPHSFSYKHELVDCSKEVSDQNFVDRDVETEKASNSCCSKRMRTSRADASSSDQVVPNGKPPDK
ncbi:hypothetical protein K2173_027994 [Erythroxylum novogranatense]|uniref:Uncharacterized protein n=1 Tax=Erythroxylum novogranatense TaxID=1862640 RepID=A0AAV8TXZ2_9ROSI|nr:hypothetical protein K2173_026940 [Erythroxylum novogranatense]KAJ8772817.1 hypothetical protein K2173_027994 [Erythroxylum novogranatense]